MPACYTFVNTSFAFFSIFTRFGHNSEAPCTKGNGGLCGVWTKGSAPPPPSPYRKHLRNKGPAAPEAALPSPSSLRDATSPKVRGFGCTGKFAVQHFTPCCRKGAEGVTRRLSAFAKGSPFGGAGAKRLRGRGCWRGDFAPV